MEKDFLTARDLAALFSVTPGTIGSWRRRGILPYLRIGKTVRFLRSDISECLKRSKRDEIQSL